MTNTLIFQKFRGPSTSKWLLAVFNILATSRQKDKTTYLVVRLYNVQAMQNADKCDELWRNGCICIAVKWVEPHAISHAAPPFYWTLLLLLLLLSSPLSHLLLSLPLLLLFWPILSLFCSFVCFLKPCKPILAIANATLSDATQVKILLQIRIQQQEKETTGTTALLQRSLGWKVRGGLFILSALGQSLGPRGAKSQPLGNLSGLGGCISQYIPPLGSVRIQYSHSRVSTLEYTSVWWYLTVLDGIGWYWMI